MDDAKKELVRNWLIKAQHDLGAAQKLSISPNAILDAGIYHCQQAAEKSIKAFLVFHDKRFEKTHDLQVLVSIAGQLEKGFSSWLDAAEQ